MSVYVDAAAHKYGRMVMCHMIADTPDELRIMAWKIGVALKWFQRTASAPHFDVCKRRRTLAVAMGAIELDRRSFVIEMQHIRQRWPLDGDGCWTLFPADSTPQMAHRKETVNYEPVRKAVALMEDAHRALAGGPADFYLRELLGAHDFLITTFSPFKVGDRVTLAVALDPEKIGDWKRDLHFLKPGEPAKVVEAWAGAEGFHYYLEFDNESWIDREGIPQPVSRKHAYGFGAASLQRIATGRES